MPAAMEDHEEIRQLIIRYCHLLDAFDASGWAALFIDDGTLDLDGTKTQGAEALRAYVVGFSADQQNSRVRHVVTNVLIDVDGDEARSKSYLVLLTPGGPTPIGMTGQYDDRLRRIDGRWKFLERRLAFDPDQRGLRATLRQLPGMAYRAVRIRCQRGQQLIWAEPAVENQSLPDR